MAWPAPSASPSRLIDKPAAWPVTTTWKDSNSFCAAASEAAGWAPAGGCAEGRTLVGAGAVQTVAAPAAEAMVQAIRSEESDFNGASLVGCSAKRRVPAFRAANGEA